MALVEKSLQALSLLPSLAEEKVVVGFSGGADSTALLHFLAYRCAAKERLIAFHVNHMIRGVQADSDEEHCRIFCKQHGIPFRCERIDVLSRCGNTAIEETARNLRYEALEHCAKENGCRFIALAHTASDNAETVLFNLIRGSGGNGACGIPLSRSQGSCSVIRPLLFCTRREVEEYCVENNLSYVTDSTNEDTSYSRNYLRHEIIPRLEKLNPKAVQSISSFSGILHRDLACLDAMASDFLKALPQKSTASIASLIALPDAVRSRVFILMAKRCGVSLSSVHLEQLNALLLNPTGGAETELPDNGIAVVLGGQFYIFPRKDYERITKAPSLSVSLREGENRFNENALIYISTNAEDEKTEPYKKQYSFYCKKGFCIEKSNLSLSARTPCKADAYKAGKITRTVGKLKNQLSLLPRFVRPLICNGEEAIWYPGFDMCDRYKGEKPTIYIHYFEKDECQGG